MNPAVLETMSELPDCCPRIGRVEMMAGNRWLQKLAESPGHSAWYVERFRKMAAEGADLHGEARFVDAMAARSSRILDAGCGPGRVGARLAELGHTVVGVDLDGELIAAAKEDHAAPTWLQADLSTFDLRAAGFDGFDVVVCAGNVMAFLDPTTRVAALSRMAAHLNPSGRIAVGFGTGREYPFDEFFADVAAARLQIDARFSTWHLHPFAADSDFVVAVCSLQV
jgi:SAM-dependent methyltransferase